MIKGTIRLNRVQNGSRYGISRGNGSFLFSPGIADPLCGWPWLLNRDHPLVELRMSIEAPGWRNTFSISPNNQNSDKIVKEVCSVGLRR